MTKQGALGGRPFFWAGLLKKEAEECDRQAERKGCERKEEGRSQP
jgi:hypothetical protein